MIAGPAQAPAPGPPDMALRRSAVLGRSEVGRPIDLVRTGDPDSGRRILVIGCIHGNEPAGIAVTRDLVRSPPPAELDLWIVPNLNPDGVAAATRANARGVDLNPQLPLSLAPARASGRPRVRGPTALSEAESRLAWRLIRRIRPAVTIWFHQPLGLVDLSGGRADVERRYARLVGLPARRLARYPGGASGWQNHRFPGTTAFVVELPPGPLPAPSARRLALAAVRLGQRGAR